MPRRNGNAEARNQIMHGHELRRPGLGAFHQIDFEADNQAYDILFFAADFKRLVTDKYFPKNDQAEEAVGPHIDGEEAFEPLLHVGEECHPDPDPVKFYNPDFMRLKVLERRISQNHAKQHRLYWNRNDIGQIKGELRNSLDRLSLSGRPLEVKFTAVQRVGDADERKLGRKLALVPDPESEAAEFLCQSHEICVSGLSKRLSKFRDPYDEFMAKLTFARVSRQQSESVVSGVIGIARQLLPITVTFAPLEFYANQSFTP